MPSHSVPLLSVHVVPLPTSSVPHAFWLHVGVAQVVPVAGQSVALTQATHLPFPSQTWPPLSLHDVSTGALVAAQQPAAQVLVTQVVDCTGQSLGAVHGVQLMPVVVVVVVPLLVVPPPVPAGDIAPVPAPPVPPLKSKPPSSCVQLASTIAAGTSTRPSHHRHPTPFIPTSAPRRHLRHRIFEAARCGESKKCVGPCPEDGLDHRGRRPGPHREHPRGRRGDWARFRGFPSPSSDRAHGITYRQAGVDIEAGHALVET
jgi:hypothetical protein